MVVFLTYFVTKPDTDQFRLVELEALADLAGVPQDESVPLILGSTPECGIFSSEEWAQFKEVFDAFMDSTCPFLYVWLPNADFAARLVARGCLIRSIYAVTGPFERSIEHLVASVATPRPLYSSLGEMLHIPVIRYEVDSIERKCPLEEKTAIIKQFQVLGHTGKIDLYSDDAVRFVIFMLHDRQSKQLRFALHAMLIASSARLFFLDHYSLKTRRYIGTTTMPPELTFLMSNLGRVKRNALVLDPFAGTGATLISAAHFGATTLGFDMDGRVLRDGAIVGSQALQDLELREAERRKKAARSGDVADGESSVAAGTPSAKPSFRQNFFDYRLKVADAFRLNFSVAEGFFAAVTRRCGSRGFVDAIVSDPPYGIREQQRKVATPTPPSPSSAAPSGTPGTGPRLAKYDTGDLMLDLVLFAGSNLVLGGYLVYWHPTVKATYTDAEIPQHPAMRIVCNIEQGMSIKVGRRLVVMQKVREVPEEEIDVVAIQAAMKNPDNCRRAIDDVHCGPESYLAYRKKREAIRDSHLQWRQEQGLVAPPLTRTERRELNMSNRAKKAVDKERKEALFHVKKGSNTGADEGAQEDADSAEEDTTTTTTIE